MKRTADVVVVGGGPAGSAAAILLARAGLQVCLLEKGTFPREKPCGEYLSPGCVPLLHRLGVMDALEAVGPQPIRGMRIEGPRGTVVTGTYPGDGVPLHGYAIPRYRLDALLVEAARRAGVTCLEGWRVVDLIRKGRRVAGVVAASEDGAQPFHASITIGADGRNSVVARRLKLFARHPSHRKVALVQRFQTAAALGDLGEVYLGRGGYCILNPQGAGTVNVGVVVDQRDLPLHQPWEGVFHDLLHAYPQVQAKLNGARPLNPLWVLGPLASRAKRVAGKGFLLVGDAAGYYDPLTGEGIYQALRGAELAATSVAEALRKRDMTARTLRRYAAAYHREFAPKDRVCQILQQIVSRPRLCEFLGRYLQGRREHVQELMGVVGDLLPPQRLLHPRFWTSLFSGKALP
ncbi:MAG: NAD(P)/FAD-dependent oxidoreductase [Candidatus Methylomirabilales bacterium]